MKFVPKPDKNALSNIKMFHGLAADAIERLYGQMQYKRFRKGDLLLVLGQRSASLLWIHTGSAKICDSIPSYLSAEAQDTRESVLNVVGPGAPLGEINFLDGQGHSATVTALEDTACFVLKCTDFRQFLSEFPQLQDNFSAHIGGIIRDKTAKIHCLTRQNLGGSIAEQLLVLASRWGQPRDAGQILIDIPLTQFLLANMTGHERSSVTHVLTTFKNKKWIAVSKDHRITIRDVNALREYSG